MAQVVTRRNAARARVTAEQEQHTFMPKLHLAPFARIFERICLKFV